VPHGTFPDSARTKAVLRALTSAAAGPGGGCRGPSGRWAMNREGAGPSARRLRAVNSPEGRHTLGCEMTCRGSWQFVPWAHKRRLGHGLWFAAGAYVPWICLLAAITSVPLDAARGASFGRGLGADIGLWCCPAGVGPASASEPAVLLRAAGRIYRWVDERGLLHFSDRPPPQPPPPPEPGPPGAGPSSAVPGAAAPGSAQPAPAAAEPPAGTPSPEAPSLAVPSRPAMPAAPLAPAGPDQASSAEKPGPDGAEAAPADITVGMTRIQVMRLWGRPDHILRAPGPHGSDEQWVYEEGPRVTQRIDLAGGRVVGVQIPDLRARRGDASSP
jgi:hypothetical protein